MKGIWMLKTDQERGHPVWSAAKPLPPRELRKCLGQRQVKQSCRAESIAARREVRLKECEGNSNQPLHVHAELE